MVIVLSTKYQVQSTKYEVWFQIRETKYLPAAGRRNTGIE